MESVFSALGTTALVATVDEAALADAVAATQAEVDAFDQACSRFRPDSDLSRLNEGGSRDKNESSGQWARVGPLLAEAIAVALAAAEASSGAVDPTIGEALSALGYDDDFAVVAARVASPRSPSAARGWREVRVAPRLGLVWLPPGTTLDLGATAKALAADRAAKAAAALTGSGVLVSLGGDIAVAGETPDGGWTIRVSEDHQDRDGPGPTVAISRGGLATSSTTVRRWRAGSGQAHHIVDPQTGLPAAGPWRTVTVAAASCVAANTAATAAIVRGEAALSWLDGHSLPARLVAVDGSVAYSGGWPEEAGA